MLKGERVWEFLGLRRGFVYSVFFSGEKRAFVQDVDRQLEEAQELVSSSLSAVFLPGIFELALLIFFLILQV